MDTKNMTKSKAAERITHAHEKSKWIAINEDATTSNGKPTKLPSTTRKGKGKRPTSAKKAITLDPSIPSWPQDFAGLCMSFWQTHTQQNLVNLVLMFLLRYLEFETKHGHYLAKRNKAAEKNEEMKACRSPSPSGESPIVLEIAFCSSVLSPERFKLYCMPGTRSRGEFLTPYDPELRKTLRKMANQGVHNNPIGEGQGDGIGVTKIRGSLSTQKKTKKRSMFELKCGVHTTLDENKENMLLARP
uniref:Uncharacterized protein n=1 Tax=Solanum tuberosum TaxID=4113 RepID=M1DSM2_SOLTU